ncbi:DUF6261 family protein, partial [Flavobacterium sp. RSB2_4_14]|uniref:DUF6261 family protein n=1 Tax=Flavobacterium sp. RSB2_4_14 TaxID=3447665 RepID=UPI003F4176AB
MKKLETISLTRLTNLEFGQHTKSVKNNLLLLGGGTLITDPILTDYIARLGTETTNYDRAMVQIFKSDETAKIAAADEARDKAFSSLLRYLNVYELSEIPEEVLAFTSLKTLFDTYGDVKKMNFEKESNAIDNLIIDLDNTQYKPHVILLNIGTYIDRLTTANNNFKTLFEGRTQETASK